MMIGDDRPTCALALVAGEVQGSGVFGRPRSSTELVEVEGEIVERIGPVRLTPAESVEGRGLGRGELS